jgi:spermidine synthase
MESRAGMKKNKLIPMTEEEEYRNAGITKEEIRKDKKMFYTSDGVKIVGFSDQLSFDKAVNNHAKIMDKVNKVFKDYPKDEFGNLIITKEIENFILNEKGKNND